MCWWIISLLRLLSAGILGVPLVFATPHVPQAGSLDALSAYQWADNQAPDTAVYDWIELRGDASATWINDISNHDDGWSAARYPIGFSFPFYAAAHDSFRVAVNGFIEFTTATGSLTNTALPSANIAGPAICAYWDDQHLDRVITGGVDVIGYRNFGAYTVIEYDSTGIYSTSCAAPHNRLKYEVILFNDGKIKVQYNLVDVCNVADSLMTVGIQANGAAGSSALQYGFGGVPFTGNVPVSGRAVWFFPTATTTTDFATEALLTPVAGAYGPGQVLAVSAVFRNLSASAHSAAVRYRLDDGETISATTAELAPFASEQYAFSTPITLPAIQGTYTLRVWCDLPGDEYSGNDTARVALSVFIGGNCASTIILAGPGPDSATYNNCGAGNNDPGVPCSATSYNDMVFRKDVAPGETATFWISSLAWVSKYLDITARWGGACPGTNTIDCFTASSTPNLNKRLTWTNSTGATQTVYVTVGNYGGSTANYCGNFTLAWQDQQVPPFALPHTQGFETVPFVPTLPEGWTQENGNGVSPVWESYGSLARTGTKCATLSGLAAGNDDWLFSPGFSLAEGIDYFLLYWRRVSSGSAPDSIEVRAGLAPTAAAMTLSVIAPDTCKRTVYTQRIGGFTSPEDGVYYIGWHSLSQGASARTMIDDISISGGACCCSVGTVWVPNQTAADSVTLLASLLGTWYGGIPRYQWFTGADCEVGNAIPGATQPSYTTHTSGSFSCRVSLLDSSACVACGSAVATVVDCGIAVPLPILEGFEAPTVPALPLCWTQTDGNGDGRTWKSSTNSPFGGSHSVYCQYSTGTAADDWLFSRPLQLSAGVPHQVSYWYRSYLPGYSDALEVRLGAEASAAAMTTVIDSTFSFSSTTWTQKVSEFTVPASGSYTIGWHCTSGVSQGGVLLDDLSIYALACCCVPPEVSIAAVADFEAVTLTASAFGGFGPPIQYQWYRGLACAAGNEIPGATDSTYTTTVSGVYSCRAARFVDEPQCGSCDSAMAEVLPCVAVTGLVIDFGGEDSLKVRLAFDATQSGLYRVYSSVDPNNDGDPRADDPQWTLAATLSVAEAGPVSWSDPADLVPYRNYAVIRVCTLPAAR